jgi:rhamnose utilization protein RhaD (predicted bifunctional aldolase and dehydrogenase)
MTSDQSAFKHVQYSWDDAIADKLDPVARLVYRSNMLGADGRITNTGGGNTSSKLSMPDPLTGSAVEVLWVKGSGGDLRTSKRENFSSLYMDKLRGLQQHYHHAPERGPKTAFVDRHAAARLRALSPRRPYAPQRRDRDRRREELPAAHA